MASEGNYQKYYRIPGIAVKLPTAGKYLPEGSVTLNVEGEVDVYPMRMADEIMLKNPDALMNGSAIESLFQSCVPGITTPALISSPDIDVLLLAIRVASSGRIMELETSCPECNRDLAFDCNLPEMLLTVKECSEDNVARLSDDITVHVRPFNVSDMSFMGMRIFEEERRLQQIEHTEDLSEEQRQNQRNLLFKRMSQLQSEMLAKTVLSINSPDGTVSGLAEAQDLLGDAPAEWVKKIDRKQKEISEGGMDKKVHAICEHCKHEWDTAIDFDPTSFFGKNSSD